MPLTKPNINKPVFKTNPTMIPDIQQGNCVWCHKPVKENEFTDELSKKEYSVTGMCQVCQDNMFNGLEE